MFPVFCRSRRGPLAVVLGGCRDLPPFLHVSVEETRHSHRIRPTNQARHSLRAAASWGVRATPARLGERCPLVHPDCSWPNLTFFSPVALIRHELSRRYAKSERQCTILIQTTLV